MTEPTTVFISYGRRDASAFVDKLAQDLKSAGFNVWRDTAELQSHRPWDDQVQSALKSSDAVVAVLTPHAVRTGRDAGAGGDESVCLDELAFARFSPPPTPIVPILLMQCEPPFVIYRHQYLDFLGAASDDAQYKRALDKLVRTIKEVAAGTPPSYRTSSLEPLDFDLYLKAKTRDFVGREWLIDDLFARLPEADGPPAIILAAEPGWGKTAFAAHLFGANPGGQLLAAHFCRADRADSIDASRFVENIIAMTALRVPSYQSFVASRATSVQDLLRAGREKEAFERLFLEPLAGLDQATLGKLPRYLLVDGLDEATATSTRARINELLAQTIGLFPERLRLVATSRDTATVLDAFGEAEIIRLDHDDPRNRNDVQIMIANLLAPTPDDSDAPGSQGVSPELGEAIAAKADGNALCAAQLSLAARRSGMDANAVAVLPRGLAALYRAIFQRRFDANKAKWQVLREILEMVVATRAALPIALVARARGEAAQYSTREAIEGISDLLSIDDDTIRLFHQTLNEFLVQPGTPYFVNPAQGAARLLDLLTDTAALQALSKPLEAFCLQNFDDWLLQCQELARYAAALPQLYDALYFSKAAEPLPYYVCGVVVSERERVLVSHLAGAGFGETVASIVSLAFTRAREQFRASGALPWLSESGRPPPDEDLRRTISREINLSFQIARFALAWVKVLGAVAPKMRPQLLEIVKSDDAAALRGLFGWLDIAVGYRALGISGYFEDQAFAIRGDWTEIAKQLE